jgi:hypothetical protein
VGNLQVTEIGGTSQAGTPGALRILNVAGAVAGIAPTLTATVTPTTTFVMPGTPVTFTLTVLGGYTTITWALDPDSPVVELTGTDLQRTFSAPYIPPGQPADVTINVTVTNAAGSASLRLFKSVVPHPLWNLKGGIWQPIAGEQSV